MRWFLLFGFGLLFGRRRRLSAAAVLPRKRVGPGAAVARTRRCRSAAGEPAAGAAAVTTVCGSPEH